MLELYRYIKYCLYANWGSMTIKDNQLGTTRDMQHDIFLYMVEKKKITELNSGSKRMAFLLSKYYPGFLGRYKYSRKSEKVLLDMEGNQIEPGVSYFIPGDIQHDLNIIASNNKVIPIIDSGKQILVHYITGEKIVYNSIAEFCNEEGCHYSSVSKWIKNGMPEGWGAAGGRAEYKYRHIKKIEYMAYTNPFHGSKTIVKKRISQASWNKRKDHDDFEFEIDNEQLQLWVHKEAGEGWLVVVSEPKGSEYYIKRLVDSKK